MRLLFADLKLKYFQNFFSKAYCSNDLTFKNIICSIKTKSVHLFSKKRLL
jgi:hypothetical protein